MMRLVSLLLIPVALISATKFDEYRYGPFEVISSAGEKESQEVINFLEQYRYTFGTMLGKPELTTIWPIRILLTEKGTQSPPKFARECYAASMVTKQQPSPEFLTALGRILLDENAGRMPQQMETGLIDLFSTLQVTGTRVTLGAPPPRKTQEWARLHMLAVDERFSGKLRVMVSNVQKGIAEDAAYRNAFALGPADVDKLVAGYTPTGTTLLNAKAVDPRRFYSRTADAAKAEFISAQVRNPDPLVPPKGDIPALTKLTEQFPKWAEPLALLSDAETDLVKKLNWMKRATDLAPRNAAYWRRFAQLQEQGNLFADAQKSWSAAERSAITEAEKESIRTERAANEQKRLDYIESEKRKAAEAERAAVDKLRQDLELRVREAERKVNESKGPVDPNAKVVEWWDGPRGDGKVSGALEKVDCLRGVARLVIRDSAGKLVQVIVRKPGEIAVGGGGEKTFGCGIQKPPRRINVEYQVKPDKALASAGDALFIEFP